MSCEGSPSSARISVSRCTFDGRPPAANTASAAPLQRPLRPSPATTPCWPPESLLAAPAGAATAPAPAVLLCCDRAAAAASAAGANCSRSANASTSGSFSCCCAALKPAADACVGPSTSMCRPRAGKPPAGQSQPDEPVQPHSVSLSGSPTPRASSTVVTLQYTIAHTQNNTAQDRCVRIQCNTARTSLFCHNHVLGILRVMLCCDVSRNNGYQRSCVLYYLCSMTSS